MDEQKNVFMQGDSPSGKKNAPLAVASFSCANISLIGLFAAQINPWMTLVFFLFPAAIVSGHLARRAMRKEPQRWTGEGMATYGLVIGYLGLTLAIGALGVVLGGYASV
ncbi:MAG: hypothetical protein COA73_13955 [Candidatus Hydrogenedentota bacterium]|nr:MAG: hypothetical protein COA73_13955 [Candidatus Hydrogenedentota bacterium]